MLFDGMIGRGKVSRNADNKERGALTHSERPTVSHIPYISIIVPVYNSEAYLPDLFSSLENQTFEDYEVIFVDDGSTDRSLSLLESFFQRDPRVSIIHQENAGGASARNRGIDHAKGELMICIDSDDTLSPVLLEHMSLPFENSDVGMVISYIDTYYEDTGEYRSMPWAVNVDLATNTPFPPASAIDLFRDVIGYIGNKMIRRSIIEKHNLRFQTIRSHDDLSFVYATMAASPKIVILDEELYHYRRRSNGSSITDTTMIDLYECAFVALYDLKSKLIAMNIWADFSQMFTNYALYMCKWKVDIAPGNKADEIRRHLRDEWFRKLDLLGFPRSYYLHSEEFSFIGETLDYENQNARKEEILRLNSEVKKLKTQNNRIRSSHSFRVGHMLTAIPRALRRIANK
ncbi:glycosyltransferase family 2 protein [Adlercreutzia equolifaciens]|uniref:glycosyltransferase family 2 protein n=1 Tax=Adlercreutzia TaxID=447020 RepID=UPI001EDD054B|nr:glycosyltransferase family 2 protein [Adlercreutzia equolifaciens]MCG4825423.1 glycosyltransferase [Adlercreutzia equolifaciens]